MKTALTAILFLLLSQPLYADSGVSIEIPFMEFFISCSRELDIPMPAALAIARVESGLKPWTLNVAGRTFRFSSKAEAMAKAAQARRDGRSFDVGIMQINNWWLDRYEISLEAAFDPLANIYLGCWIFKQELARHKDLRLAIGAYHSPDPLRASRYADQVMKALVRGPVSQSSTKTTAVVSRPASQKYPPVNKAAPLKVGYNFDNSMKVRKK